MSEFQEALLQLEKEKGIQRDLLIKTIENAICSAYKKNFGSAQNIKVELCVQTGKAKVLALKEVVEKVKDPNLQIDIKEAEKIKKPIKIGEKIEIEVIPKDFGRVAAQTAKQVMVQKIREAERKMIYEEFKDKVGEVITGVIQRVTKQGVFVNLGKTEGFIPLKEQAKHETYRVGERLKCYVCEVKQTSKEPQVILSRTHPDLVRKLFELEVPEIFEGIVEIKGVVREPGFRSKIAVYSRDSKIDSVGACVGIRGARVQAAINELSGEKIDIIQYSNNHETFIKNALSPSNVLYIKIDEKTKTAVVVVADNQLSLAIGKGGQNARLAAKLTGWKIDIKSESQTKKEAADKIGEVFGEIKKDKEPTDEKKVTNQQGEDNKNTQSKKEQPAKKGSAGSEISKKTQAEGKDSE